MLLLKLNANAVHRTVKCTQLTRPHISAEYLTLCFANVIDIFRCHGADIGYTRKSVLGIFPSLIVLCDIPRFVKHIRRGNANVFH